MQAIEIFRPGRHTAMDGRQIAFSEGDLVAAASAYDPALHEAPIVVGHPRTDAPAYGWVQGLATGEAGGLEAMPHQVDPAFAELVRAGRFKHVSASFYLPDSPANPKPGAYYLRHVGFLGAQPPAIKGLRPVQFAEAEGVVEFADAWALSTVARLFRGLRDWLITQAGQQQADIVLPGDAIDSVAAAAVAEMVAPPAEVAAPVPAYSEPNQEVPSVADEQAAARAAELQARETQLQQREAAFAEREAAQRQTENATWFDGLVREGRALPAQRSLVLAFMERLDATEAVSFDEGAAQTEATAFRTLLGGYPKLVEFREVAPGDGEVLAEDASAEAIARASVAYQEAMQAKGITVTNIEAIKAVTGKAS